MANAPRWPDGQDPGLLIGEAAGLLGISAKAIGVYHDRGLLPEAPRDAIGYRRYGAAQLVGLARITRLRAVGLALRETMTRAGAAGAVLAIAHRLSTVVAARRIIVLDGGRVRAAGTHAELIGSDDLYAELAATQLRP